MQIVELYSLNILSYPIFEDEFDRKISRTG